MLPNEILTNILGYLSYFEAKEVIEYIYVPNKATIKKIIHDHNLTIVTKRTKRECYIQGLLHNEYGPAREYFMNSTAQRVVGLDRLRRNPPSIFAKGSKLWYQYGKLHRINGPAIEYANSTLEWYQNGKLHNEYGPAIIRANGISEWFIKGDRVQPF
jgi:hypothetical protein